MTEQQALPTLTMSAKDVADLRLGVGLSDTREATLDLGEGQKRYRVVSITKVAGAPDQVLVTWRPLRDGELSF